MLPVAFATTAIATASALAFVDPSWALYTSCQETTALAQSLNELLCCPFVAEDCYSLPKTSHYYLCPFGASNTAEIK